MSIIKINLSVFLSGLMIFSIDIRAQINNDSSLIPVIDLLLSEDRTTENDPNDQTIVIRKQNTNFSIDGNEGARQGQQIYLFETNTASVNQQWVEVKVEDNYFIYQKRDTNVCLDGGDGGENRQFEK